MQREQKLIQAFREIGLFNKLIGNKSSYEAVFNQLQRVQEELDETLEAIAVNVSKEIGESGRELYLKPYMSEEDKLELLDGVCDQLVVVLDLIAKLEALGYNVLDGLLAVTENNASKFTKERIVAEYTQRHYEEELDTPCTIVYNEEHKLYGVRRIEDGKLLKPINYVSVDLKEFLPKGE